MKGEFVQLVRANVAIAVFAVSMVGNVGCQSANPKPTATLEAPTTSALENGRWVKVKADPPTYFPKGIPKDHPTTYDDGSWVHAGDESGTRFFVPARGDQAAILQWTAEAEAAMTASARKDLKGKRRAGAAKGVGNAIGEGFVRLLGGVGEALGSMPSGGGYSVPEKDTGSATKSSKSKSKSSKSKNKGG